MARSVAIFRDGLVTQQRLEAEKASDSLGKLRQAERMGALIRGFEGSVGAIVGMVSSAATELQATARQLADLAQETTGRAETVSTAAESAGASVTSVAGAAEQLGSSIGEIARQVGHSREQSASAVRETRASAMTVAQLSQAAARIEDIVGLISGIAGQTNLLALNATIEAARAGEAGRGFAVVAAEVKALAEQTARATADISAQIGGIQTATAQAGSAIGGVVILIDGVNDAATAISIAVDQQGAADPRDRPSCNPGLPRHRRGQREHRGRFANRIPDRRGRRAGLRSVRGARPPSRGLTPPGTDLPRRRPRGLSKPLSPYSAASS